jgi:hypothetical protein
MTDEQVKTALASLTRDEASRRDLASVIIEWIKPNHLTTDLISLFLDTRSLMPGDMLVKKLRKPNVKVRRFVPGTVHLADEIEVSDRVNYILEGNIVKVMCNLWDLERGEIGTVQEIRQEMTSKLVDFYAGKVFTLLSTVWGATNTPDNYAEVSGDLTKTALDAAIDRINYRAGGVRAIVGVKNSLLPITEFAGYATYDSHKQMSDPILTEALSEGWIGKYRGVNNIVGLSQTWNNPEANTALLPEDYVLVIGNNAGEFVTFGDPQWKEYTMMEPTPPYFVLEAFQSWGLIVDNAEGIYVIRLV